MSDHVDEAAQHARWMNEAVALARAGMRIHGGGPFGAVIVADGELVGRGCNQVTPLLDPTAHAAVADSTQMPQSRVGSSPGTMPLAHAPKKTEPQSAISAGQLNHAVSVHAGILRSGREMPNQRGSRKWSMNMITLAVGTVIARNAATLKKPFVKW